MKEIVGDIIGIVICLIVLAIGVYGICKKVNDKDEYIQQLEQSLQEQIQEKEVYMKMLEQSELLKGE